MDHELSQQPQSIHLRVLDDKSKQHISSTSRSSKDGGVETQHDLEAVNTPSGPSVLALQRWNQPRGNVGRFVASFFSMFVYGLNDAAPGAALPYLERYYNLNYTIVSLIFLCPWTGYAIAAFTNSWFHHKFGQRGIALAAPVCQLIAFVTLSLHPPWPVVVIFSCLIGFSNGLIDAAWSAWAGHMEAGNVLEGSLHAFYALGCTFSPLIITNLVVTRGLDWYYFYYMLAGLAAVSLFASGSTFWSKTAEVYQREHPREEGVSSTKTALKNKVTWLCCAFFLVYVGTEAALGGWVVSFMLHVRGATPYASGIVGTGFWAGMTLGRSLLGIVTHSLIEQTNKPPTQSPSSNSLLNTFRNLRLTERSIIAVYLLLAIALELLFWLIPSITASAIAIAFLGMAIGPVFPSGVIMATKLLPGHLHVPSIGFSTALGGTGGAIFPFVVGAVAQRKGVQVLQPIVLAMLVVLFVVWLCFPRLKAKRGGDGREQ